MKRLFTLLIANIFTIALFAQDIQSPDAFLGYSLGDEFTYHHKVVDYYNYVAGESEKVRLIPYGQTNERRPLLVALVTAEENMGRLEEIRKNNLRLTGIENSPTQGNNLPIVWLSYNVHGDESSSMEAALKVLHTLATTEEERVLNWLKDMVIVLDPCINPDGRDRYAHFYNQFRARIPDANVETIEHRQPWPGGRYNHYLFDLNRDWAWQTQVESQQRMKLYQQWMPQVHVDFHEMGANSPYFFAPAARPYHEVITPWQVEFQEHIGRNHAKYFDEENWLFFTKEVFDLLYPSYGDTWPVYNGAIGMTYEQGGGGRGGLAVITNTGDTLTLNDRIAHHYTTSFSTIETAHTHKEKLLKEFQTFFLQGLSNPVGEYKSYIIRGDNKAGSLEAFCDLLDKQGIQYGYGQATRKPFLAYGYQDQKESSINLQYNDIVISAYQPHSKLVKVLLEPQTVVEDSATYDLTGWSLPYVYNLEAYATSTKISLKDEKVSFSFEPQSVPEQTAIGYLFNWEETKDVRFLSALYQEGIRVRTLDKTISLHGKSYAQGTLLVLKKDNKQGNLDEMLIGLANEHKIILDPAFTGFADRGPDFGSGSVRYLPRPKVALLGGDGTTPTSVGAVWHYFEQQIGYPVSILKTDELNSDRLNNYNVLVLASGYYGDQLSTILDFAQRGGRVIAFDRAISSFANAREDDSFRTQLARAISDSFKAQKDNGEEEMEEKEEGLKKYADRRRSFLSESVEGSIYKVELDETHPLAYGLGKHTYFMKRNRSVYPMLKGGGWTVGIFPDDAYVSGFVGNKLKKRIPNSMALGVENMGRGSIVYIADSPVIRSFWYTGQLLLGNAVFMME